MNYFFVTSFSVNSALETHVLNSIAGHILAADSLSICQVYGIRYIFVNCERPWL